MSWSPAGSTASTSQSTHSTVPASRGLPLAVSPAPWTSKRSGALVTKARQTCSCPAPSTLTQKRPAAWINGQVVLLRSGRNPTSGGGRGNQGEGAADQPAGGAAVPPGGGAAR